MYLLAISTPLLMFRRTPFHLFSTLASNVVGCSADPRSTWSSTGWRVHELSLAVVITECFKTYFFSFLFLALQLWKSWKKRESWNRPILNLHGMRNLLWYWGPGKWFPWPTGWLSLIQILPSGWIQSCKQGWPRTSQEELKLRARCR